MKSVKKSPSLPNENRNFPRILFRYSEKDFATLLKARFIYYLHIAVIVAMTLIIISTTFIQLSNPITFNGIDWPVIGIELTIWAFFIGCFVLLIYGHLNLSAHLLIIFAFISIWLVLFINKGDHVIQLDTIVYILAVLTTTPIIVSSKKNAIIAYTVANILILALYAIFYKLNTTIELAAIIDFVTDSFFAITFIGVISYHIFRINKISLEKAINDINERKIAEEALKQSEKRYREMTELLPQTVFETDQNGILTYANKNGFELYGYTENEFEKGINILETVIPEDKPIVKENIKKLLQDQKDKESIYSAVKKDGSTFPVQIYSAPIIENGNFKGFRGIIVDISDRIKAEKELDNYRKNLELLVNERTEELEATNEELQIKNEELYNQKEELKAALNELNRTQNQLIESEKMASLGILAAGIAHEINNPLNFIRNGIIGIENYLNDNHAHQVEHLKPLIDAINLGVNRASGIVTSLNHFSRSTESINEICDIHQIIDHCIIMMQNQNKYKIIVEKKYTRESFILVGNDGKLHQAFLNIISNAYHALKDKGCITIETLINNHFIEVSIKDDGHGISNQNLIKIFDPFFTTKPPGRGTGLGLSITYNIIKEHQGTIKIESQENVGTNVLVSLPIQRSNPLL